MKVKVWKKMYYKSKNGNESVHVWVFLRHVWTAFALITREVNSFYNKANERKGSKNALLLQQRSRMCVCVEIEIKPWTIETIERESYWNVCQKCNRTNDFEYSTFPFENASLVLVSISPAENLYIENAMQRMLGNENMAQFFQTHIRQTFFSLFF